MTGSISCVVADEPQLMSHLGTTHVDQPICSLLYTWVVPRWLNVVELTPIDNS